MQRQLELQRREFEDKIDRLDPLRRPRAKPRLSEERWRRRGGPSRAGAAGGTCTWPRRCCRTPRRSRRRRS